MSILHHYAYNYDRNYSIEQYQQLTTGLEAEHLQVLSKYLVPVDGVVKVRSRDEMLAWREARSNEVAANWAALGIPYRRGRHT